VKDEDNTSSSSIEPPQSDGNKVINRFRSLSHWLRDQDPAPELRVKNFIEFSIIASAVSISSFRIQPLVFCSSSHLSLQASLESVAGRTQNDLFDTTR
jgi:hypothetical protein